MCITAGPVLSLLCMLPFEWPAFARSPLGHRLHDPIILLWVVAFTALNGACLGLLVRALGAALRSLGDTPPAWAPRAVGAYIAWRIL